jgi:phosphoenolpyruvate carboxylase
VGKNTGSTDKAYKFYVIFGIFLVIVPMMGMIFFIFFIHGLTSNALSSNVNIELKRKLIEINVHDTTKNVELLRHLIENHLLVTEKENYSKLISVRKPEEHAKKKKEYLEKIKKD